VQAEGENQNREKLNFNQQGWSSDNRHIRWSRVCLGRCSVDIWIKIGQRDENLYALRKVLDLPTHIRWNPRTKLACIRKMQLTRACPFYGTGQGNHRYSTDNNIPRGNHVLFRLEIFYPRWNLSRTRRSRLHWSKPLQKIWIDLHCWNEMASLELVAHIIGFRSEVCWAGFRHLRVLEVKIDMLFGMKDAPEEPQRIIFIECLQMGS